VSSDIFINLNRLLLPTADQREVPPNLPTHVFHAFFLTVPLLAEEPLRKNGALRFWTPPKAAISSTGRTSSLRYHLPVGATEQIREACLLPVVALLAPFPFCDSGVSFRQRQRVHQLYGVQTAEQVADRADQIAAAALQPTRVGGGKE